MFVCSVVIINLDGRLVVKSSDITCLLYSANMLLTIAIVFLLSAT